MISKRKHKIIQFWIQAENNFQAAFTHFQSSVSSFLQISLQRSHRKSTMNVNSNRVSQQDSLFSRGSRRNTDKTHFFKRVSVEPPCYACASNRIEARSSWFKSAATCPHTYEWHRDCTYVTPQCGLRKMVQISFRLWRHSEYHNVSASTSRLYPTRNVWISVFGFEEVKPCGLNCWTFGCSRFYSPVPLVRCCGVSLTMSSRNETNALGMFHIQGFYSIKLQSPGIG